MLVVMVAMFVLVMTGGGVAFLFLRAPSPSTTPPRVAPSSPPMPWTPAATPSIPPSTPLQVARPVRGIFTPGLPVDSGGYPHIDYALVVTTPGSFTVDLMSDNTSQYDPYLRLLLNGQEIAHDDDGGGSLQSRLQQTLGPGTYTVRVSKFGASQVSTSTGFTLAVMGPPQAVAMATPAAPSPTGPSRAQVTIDQAHLVVSGGLSNEQVLQVVNGRMGQVNACYERARVRNPSLSGTVVYVYQISRAGLIISVTVGSTTLNDVATTNCITAVIRRLRFPSPGGTVDVTMPMEFQGP